MPAGAGPRAHGAGPVAATPAGRDLSYGVARGAICDGAGRLVAVRHGCYPDLPGTVSAVALSFESGQWLVMVDPDDDSVRIQELSASRHREFDFCDPAEGSPWAPALGRRVSWFWALENQRGYVDGVQLSFADAGRGPVPGAGDEVCQVQLIAAASCWRIHGWTA